MTKSTGGPANAARPTPTTPTEASHTPIALENADGSNVTFASLGISTALVNALAKGGITVPTPVQAMTIADALAGKDVCGKARTGSGKTLAFGLPMIERGTKSAPRLPQGLVLVPTRELASQVARSLALVSNVRGIRIAAVYGGM